MSSSSTIVTFPGERSLMRKPGRRVSLAGKLLVAELALKEWQDVWNDVPMLLLRVQELLNQKRESLPDDMFRK